MMSVGMLFGISQKWMKSEGRLWRSPQFQNDLEEIILLFF
jgi:hypothetical protein